MVRSGKRLRRLTAVLLAAALFMSLFVNAGVSAKTASDASGKWVHAKNGKWWYRYSDGTWPAASWLQVGGKWYHFNAKGWMQTGWIRDGGDWYYLGIGGSMRTGWVRDNGKWYYMNKSGRMRTGWLQEKGKWYFLGGNGAMKTGEITVKGKRYLMGEDGALQEDLTERDACSAALSESGFRLLQQVCEQEQTQGQNVLISPVSAQMALGMTATGSDTDSNTQKEMMQVLMPGCNAAPADLNSEMSALTGRMTSTKYSDKVSWQVSNSVWSKTNDTVQLRESFVADVMEAYGAEFFEEPFDESTVQKVNDWVKENTRDRIPKILDSLTEDTVILLINALAFDGAWQDPVEDERVQKGTFTNADGTVSNVNMMSTHERRAILWNGGIGLIRPYKGGEYTFVAILPPEGQTAEEYLELIVSTDGEFFSEAYRNADTKRGVNAKIPEFKVEYGVLLNDSLKALGMQEAFSRDDACFGAMVTEDSDPVYISKVIQKTSLKLDRYGTEAAAATVVAMEKNGAALDQPVPYEVILDRPFIYGIVDNATGVPIFLGIQNCMPEGE